MPPTAPPPARPVDAPLQRRIDTVRRFDRWTAAREGALAGRRDDLAFRSSQARLLDELAHRDGVSASALATTLGLDPSHLSRLVAGLERRGLVLRARDRDDARRVSLALTGAGRRVYIELDRQARAAAERTLAPLSDGEQRRLAEAMATIERLVGPAPSAAPDAVTLRAHEPGDLGWIVSRHGALYASEYGFDATFEAMVADIAAKFLRELDPSRERAWIAERDGERVGSVLVIAQSRRVAKLRLLFVEPQARNTGLGRRLVAEAIRYSRAVGYRRLVLWTNDVLHAARRLYEEAGFVLEREEPHRSFGVRLIGQYWALAL